MGRLSVAYQGVLRSLPHSERLNRVSWGADALFHRILVLADGAGRYHGDAHAVACFACQKRLRHGSTDFAEVEKFLQELEHVGLVFRYEVDGELHLQVYDFFTGGDRARRSTFPDPPTEPPRRSVAPGGASSAPSGTGQCQGGTDTPPDRGSEIGDQGSEIGDRRERAPRRSRAGARREFDPKAHVLELDLERGSTLLPTIDRWLEYQRENRRSWKPGTWKEQLAAWLAEPELAKEAVSASIRRGWKTVDLDWVRSRGPSPHGSHSDARRSAIDREIEEALRGEVQHGQS